MPTLLEKPSSPAQLPTQVLQSRHRWERWRGVLVALLVGLVATLAALFIHPPESLKVLAAIWLGGFFLTGIAAIVAWHFAPGSLADTAQGIDRNLAAKNRLETMASLHGSTSPLATAQREETADYLQHEPRARPVRALPWLLGGVIALALVHFIMLAGWLVPALLHPPTPTPVPPPAPKEPPHASITWKSPEPESMANPVEEVPTVAVADSTTGLLNLTLEVSVNGVPKKSQPLPAKPYDTSGKHEIKVSLYMDELEVEPYDTVSYYLRGQRIADQKIPETASTIQFIQVRPFRDDVAQMPPGTPHKDYDLLIRLKLAQLKSVKENFILAHTDLAVTDPIRMKENDRVGKNQAALSTTTEQIVQVFIQDGMPAEIVDLLRQAEPFMDDASKKILTNQNTEAVAPQEKALSLIIAVEKYFIKTLSPPKSGPTSQNPDDPFKDKQLHELVKRFETAAGQLEQLAKNQAKLAKDVGSPTSPDASNPAPTGSPDKATTPPNSTPANGQSTPSPTPATTPGDASKPVPLPTPQSVDPFGPDADKGTLAERQARVLQGVEALLTTNNVLPPTVNDALQDAQKHATESVHQLDQGNTADAREPAAAAAQDLQRAVAEMNKAGDAATKLAMEQAQQQLNAAAQQLKDLAKDNPPGAKPPGLADVAAKVQDAQKKAADAADQQQQTGSAQDAQRLADLANQIGTQHIAKDLGDMAAKGLDVNQAQAIGDKLQALADQAAHGMNTGKPTAQEIARMISSLEASRANLARLAEKAGAPGTQPLGAHSPTPDDHGQGQDPGKNQGQGQEPGKDQGQGKSDQSGKDQGQDPGQGKGDQPGKDQGQGTQPGGQPGPGSAPGTAPGGTAPGGSGTMGDSGLSDAESKAYHETLADVQDEAQQASTVVPHADTQQVLNALQGASAYQKIKPTNVVQGYQTIAPPLDKLIQDLTALVDQVKREDILKQPDLDEAPPSYRPAVSNYFENMSRDYHPDQAADDTKKP